MPVKEELLYLLDANSSHCSCHGPHQTIMDVNDGADVETGPDVTQQCLCRQCDSVWQKSMGYHVRSAFSIYTSL